MRHPQTSPHSQPTASSHNAPTLSDRLTPEDGLATPKSPHHQHHTNILARSPTATLITPKRSAQSDLATTQFSDHILDPNYFKRQKRLSAQEECPDRNRDNPDHAPGPYAYSPLLLRHSDPVPQPPESSHSSSSGHRRLVSAGARHVLDSDHNQRYLKFKGDTDMDEISTGSESDYANSWIAWFLSTKGNEYFCEVDEEYILDRFNLTGLNSEVQYYGQALDLITDALAEEELDEVTRESVEGAARHLYGLIHARYIITSRGLSKMLDKYKKADFGRCPRILCWSQPLLPVGLSDAPYSKAVKLYCPRCEDIYSPKSSRHGAIDGAYFGTTFPHMLFMVYPNMVPNKSIRSGASSSANNAGNSSSMGVNIAGGAPGSNSGVHGAGAQGIGTSSNSQTGGTEAALKAERYRPRIFGFKVNEIAKLHRWQESLRDEQISRLKTLEAKGALE